MNSRMKVMEIESKWIAKWEGITGWYSVIKNFWHSSTENGMRLNVNEWSIVTWVYVG